MKAIQAIGTPALWGIFFALSMYAIGGIDLLLAKTVWLPLTALWFVAALCPMLMRLRDNFRCAPPVRALAIVVLLGCNIVAAPVQEPAFPGESWTHSPPESQGVDPDLLSEAMKFLKKSTGRNGVDRTVVVRHRNVVWSGTQADTPQKVWSITKAFTSTCHGLLIEDDKCTMATLAKDHDPSLAKLYPRVTLRHLATMTSGIDGTGGFYDCGPQGRCDANALTKPLVPFFPPGEKFLYWDEATQHYGAALTAIAGEPLSDLLDQRVLHPIGVTTFNWLPDLTDKATNWTGGAVISANDLARFGLLYLERGRWRDDQLIPASWVDQATQVQVPVTIPNAFPDSNRTGAGIYGYHWWPNGVLPSGQRRWPDAPQNAYSRSGYNNNHLIIVPEWNIVVVRLGLDLKDDRLTTAEINEFLKRLGKALAEAP